MTRDELRTRVEGLVQEAEDWNVGSTTNKILEAVEEYTTAEVLQVLREERATVR